MAYKIAVLFFLSLIAHASIIALRIEELLCYCPCNVDTCSDVFNGNVDMCR